MIHRFGRISSKSLVAGDIACDHAAGTYHRILTDHHPTEDRATGPDRRPATDPGFKQFPVVRLLRTAVGTGRPRVPVVGEHHSVANEDLVFDRYPFANESVAGNLAARSDAGSLLDFHEAPDPCLVANFAAVKIDETMQAHIPAKPDIGSNPEVV